MNATLPKSQSNRSLVIYAGVLSSLTAFSIDITLPAIPQMARDFAAPVSQIQLTISLFVMALGIGQLFWGVISDRYGRKPAITGGLIIFIVASSMAAFANSPETLIAARVLQGFGASCAGISSRAMIRDLFTGPALATNMATATAIFAIGPIVAPFVGAALLTIISWRAVFFALAALASCLLIALLWIDETSKHKTAISLGEMSASIGRIIANRQSRYFLFFGPVAMSSMIFILSILPAVYAAEYGVEGLYFAALFAMHGVGIIIGQLINKRLIKRYGVSPALTVGAIVLVVASGLMLGLAAINLDGPITMALALILFATSFLVVVANAGSLFLDPHGSIAAFAAAFSGCAAQLGAGLVVSALVFFIQPSALAFATGLFAICVCIVLPALWWLKTASPVHTASQTS